MTAGLLAAVCFATTPGEAQSIMRSPSISIPSRIPTINPNVTGRAITSVGPRYSPNLAPPCGYAYRDQSGECSGKPVASDGGGSGNSGNSGNSGKKGAKGSRGGSAVQSAAVNLQTVAGQLVAELDGALTDAQADALARRHGLARIGSQNFPLIGATIGLFRITDGRAVDVVRRELAADAGVRSVQSNFRYRLQQQKAEPGEGDPAQYALVKLRLAEAHALSRGGDVLVAVIDSGIDANHPELSGAIADSFDALAAKEGPHSHGTGVAGAIVAHARLMGSAPAARLVAIRAFGVAAKGAESNSYVILKSLDYAALHGAQIINMSFAGPKDDLIDRAIAAIAARGIVMVAAAGNAGAKSPPLYPAANANVIAVSATDAQDRLFAASNRGGYVAIAAPGVDIFLPAPDQKYQMASGTSFSSAYVSGVAALMLARNPALKRDELRDTLLRTARDLGSPGRDDLFGAGEADAFAAVQAVGSAPAAAPVVVAPQAPRQESVSEQKDMPVTRDLAAPGATVASDKSAVVGGGRPAAQ